MSLARRCSGQLVISSPATEISPESMRNEPATAFSKVELPEPLMPIITMNEPSSTLTLTDCSARSSFGVPGLNVLLTVRTSSMGGPRIKKIRALEQLRRDEGQKHKYSGDKSQVIGIQPDP